VLFYGNVTGKICLQRQRIFHMSVFDDIPLAQMRRIFLTR
jgi:hypothetical protein